jgi:outer membrane biosynthesis protein TonB
MAATAAIIIKQATAGVSGVVDAEEVIAKAEVAATIAADTAIRKQLGDDDSPSEETIEPVETATEEKIEEPVEEPVEEPAEEPAEEPVEVKEEKVVEKVVEKVEEKATKSKSGDSISSRKF